jgi:putative endopeptidase
VHTRFRLFRAIVVGLIVAVPAAAQQAASVSASKLTSPKAIDRANLDTTCAPCADFYAFANGGWWKRTAIPADKGAWGSVYQLQAKNDQIVREIMEGAAADVHAGKARAPSSQFKIGAFFAACMDTTAIEALETKPIATSMARIAAIKSSADLPAAIAALENSNGLALFSARPGQDSKNANRIIAIVGQGGALSLPEKNYYISQDSSMRSIREQFEKHVSAMFRLYGESAADATAHAKTVLAIETEFAIASMDRVTMRNPDATYHLMTLAQFDSIAPRMNWATFLATLGAPADLREINVQQPDFFKAMDGVLASIPAEDWKALLRWRLLNTAAGSLPKRFANEDYAFHKILNGQTEPSPRWLTCVRITDNALGGAVGQEYVARTFSPAAKARATAFVDNMVSVLHDQIGQLDWMSDSTKAQAIAKLDGLTRKIGYPDTWRDYSKLEVRVGEFYDNYNHWYEWFTARNWAKVGKPIDRTDWTMTVPTVNATYTSQLNQILVPAGFLQPPYYDPSADDAVNYGGIGAVIGHEMSHGFDDAGRRFDANGNLRDWWTKADADKYNVQAQLLVAQFNAYTIVDSTTHVNGRLTLGENIGDLGGVKIAYLALQKSLKAHGRPANIDGFTPEQRFFLAYAQVRGILQTNASAKAQVNSDPHAPEKWRVNGPLSNMPEFKAAWGCKDGDLMARPDSMRARIW